MGDRFRARKMVGLLMLVMPSVLGLLSVQVLAQGSTPPGFVSISCGLPDGQNYTDSHTGLLYISDAQFIQNGESHTVPSIYNGTWRRYSTLRSFSSGSLKRNCYTIKQLNQGNKYLVRAFFLYGNYDGTGNFPEFDLLLDLQMWATVNISDASSSYFFEILTVAQKSFISVCLINTGKGTPFISLLDLRPLKNTLYPGVQENVSLSLVYRFSYGELSKTIIRYPDDPYDRIWRQGWMDPTWLSLSTNSTITYSSGDPYEVPWAVLRTAASPESVTSMNFWWSDPSSYQQRFVMHFVDFISTRSRSFNIYLNNAPWYDQNYTPPYLSTGYIPTEKPYSQSGYNFAVVPTNTSTLPPILNALEVYNVLNLVGLVTNTQDVYAIMAIKEQYNVIKNWMGDPCFPSTYIWDGLACFNSTIQTLNLSSSNLTGVMIESFGYLTSIRVLDLSHNNLTGAVPDILAKLPSLTTLNLANNNLSGRIPSELLRRSQDESLLLSVDGNPYLCINGSSCESNLNSTVPGNPDQCTNGNKCKRKMSIKLVITVVAIALVVLPLVVGLVAMSIRRVRKKGHPPGFSRSNSGIPSYEDNHQGTLRIDARQFTSVELEKMTNKFEEVIGKGGFGQVYRGCIENGVQVAVKVLSNTSPQGFKEFLAEVQHLSRVHHKNLLSLVGYCRDGSYLALIYNYMAEGNLQDYIRGKASHTKILSWEQRLRILLEAAQGLEYLHTSCDPPIIHRDVKTGNILLNERLEAKVADFGLSKTFQADMQTHVSTCVAGTPGYVDPLYHATFELTEKSDVYSFGVVLLEVISGQSPILTSSESIHITNWANQKLTEGDIGDFIDPRLENQFDVNSAWKVVDVAFSCTALTLLKRPRMAYVVSQLKEALLLTATSESNRLLCLDGAFLSQQEESLEIPFAANEPELDGPSAR